MTTQPPPATVRNDDPLMTIADVSGYTGLSETFVRRRISEGALPVVRLTARALRVRRSALEHYLSECTR